jgi:hypothetical protein
LKPQSCVTVRKRTQKHSYPDALVVTAAIDDIFVRHAADVNRDIAFHARINPVGHKKGTGCFLKNKRFSH